MIDVIPPGIIFSALLASLVIVSIAWHLRNKVRRVERSASEMTKRFWTASGRTLREQHKLKEFVRKLPFPVMVLDLQDGLVVEESEFLTKKFLKSDKKEHSETPFSFFFQHKNRYPYFLPRLRKMLDSDELLCEPFNDVVSLFGDEGRNLEKLDVTLEVIVFEKNAIVAFDFSENEKLLSGWAHLDNKTIRSILNESDMLGALSHASALLHCCFNGGFSCGVSVLDRENKTLNLIWQAGMETSVEHFIRHLPLIFGGSPQATAAILEKEVTMNCLDNHIGIHAQAQIPERLRAWQSYPIKSVNETVLGTFDLLVFEECAELPGDECIANFLFVVSVLLERTSAMSTIVRQTRADQVVKEVSEMLLVSDVDLERDVLHRCFAFLQEASELSEGSLGLIYENGNGQIRSVGKLFGVTLGMDGLNGSCESSVRCYLQDNEEVFYYDSGMVCLDVSLLDVGSAGAQRLVRDLPVCEIMDHAVFLVCPMIMEGALKGVLVFGVHSEPTESQIGLLSMVSPSLINYLIRERLFEHLQRRADHDQLTGLFNRGYVENELKSEIERSRRYKNELSVVLFDIDNFKLINDEFGHDIGDAVLKQIASRVQASVRSVDIIGRWGGAEFMVILAETNEEDAICVAENIRCLIENDVYSVSKPVTISAGIAQFRDGDNLSALIKRADLALYEAKNEG